LKSGDIQERISGGLSAIAWKDEKEVYMLSNHPPVEINFCDERKEALKPGVVERPSKHLAYVEQGDGMVNSYPMSRCTVKWTKKLSFHLLDLRN
jgi:hypothetical protein